MFNLGKLPYDACFQAETGVQGYRLFQLRFLFLQVTTGLWGHFPLVSMTSVKQHSRLLQFPV